MRNKSVPLFLNPVRNPLLRWVFAPLGLFISISTFTYLVSVEYFSQSGELKECTIFQHPKKGDQNLINTIFWCAESPKIRFYFRSKLGADQTEKILSNLCQKKTSIKYKSNFFESDVSEITSGNNSFEGIVAAEDSIFIKMIFSILGIVWCFGSIICFFPRIFIKNEYL